MKNIDRRIIVIVAFIFIVGLSYGLMRYLISQKEEPQLRPPGDLRRYVKTELVEYRTINTYVEESGRISSVRDIDIVAEAPGKILEGRIKLKKGAEFARGDLLFTIYKDEAALTLQSKKSQFQNNLANILPDIRMDFKNSEDDFFDFFKSIELDKNIPEFPNVNDEKLKIFLASRNVLSDYYSIRRDELQLSRHSIYAPFNGTFTEVYLEAGAYTNTGGRVAHAIQTDKLEMEVPLRQVHAAWINIGNKVDVSRAGDPVSWKGKVVRKGQFIDDGFQRQAIIVNLDNNKSHLLLNGEYLKAVFPEYPVTGVMEIPRNAVFNSDEVFIVVDGRLEKRTIEIIKINDKTLLFRGLKEGSLLVVQALINVHEGTVVTTEVEANQKPGNKSGGMNTENRAAKEKGDKGEKDTGNDKQRK